MRTTTMTITLALALATLVACKKENSAAATCTRVCGDILKEEQAACSDDACKQEAKEKFEACEGLCTTIASARSAPKTQEQEAKEAQDKCAKNDAEACATLGGAYLLGKGGMPKDEAKGAELTKKACEMGAAFGCELYGRALEKGMGMPPDRATALTYWDKACKGGAGGACRSLALDLETSDPKRIPLLETACEKGDALGCMGLGAAYLHGDQGTPKDLAKAKQFLQKSCDLGADSACEKAREL